MKHPRIEDLVEDARKEIRSLVRKMELADINGNQNRYIQYADAIVDRINEIKRLKRIAKFYNFIDKVKKAIRGE